MKVYIVFMEGIYRHDMRGVYADFFSAVDRALECCREEGDGYHSWAVAVSTVGVAMEDSRYEIGRAHV